MKTFEERRKIYGIGATRATGRINIPSYVLQAIGVDLKQDDEVAMYVEDNKIVISKI